MAVLSAPSGRRLPPWLIASCFAACGIGSAVFAQTVAWNEYQIKAVFLFNFARFVEWPPAAFNDPRAPFVIGVLGDDPFGRTLDEAAGGETINGRPLVVRRYRRAEEIGDCHILFISRSEGRRLDEIFTTLRNRSLLTVGDADDFAMRGGMIRFLTENRHVRLRINLEATKAAHLVVSSKLLRPADIVEPGKAAR